MTGVALVFFSLTVAVGLNFGIYPDLVRLPGLAAGLIGLVLTGAGWLI